MPTTQSLVDRLAAGDVLLLDGGVGTEIEARGVPMNSAVWCGLAAIEYPDIVQGTHEAYIRAGAEIITANTFASNRLALEPAGFGDRVAEINRRAVEAATAAREAAAESPVLVAGSLSPHDAKGIPAEEPAFDVILDAFREQVAVQAEAGVDLFALEMIPSSSYGRAAATAAAESGLPVLLGITAWSGDGGWLHDGGAGPLVDALLQDEQVAAGVAAITVMHTDVGMIEPTLDQVRAHWDGPLGAYAHHGDWIPPNWIFKDITPEQYADAAERWLDKGIQIVGGCCGIRPGHIAAVRERLPS